MAPNFKSLLKRPAGEATRPPALPAGLYPAIIKTWEEGDNNKNKTPYVRFTVGLSGWPDDVPEDERLDKTGKALDLSKKTFRRDFYTTDDAVWRLDEFLRELGMELSGRAYEEVLPEVIGSPCFADVRQIVSQRDGEVMNVCENLLAQG